MKSSSHFLKQKIVAIWNSNEEYFGFNKYYDIRWLRKQNFVNQLS